MTSPTPQDLDTLNDIVGEKGLIRPGGHGGDDLVPYETCVRYGSGQAAFVVRPATSKEVSRVLAYCHGRGIILVPQSGNSGLVGASTPDGSGTQGVLSFDRLTGTSESDATTYGQILFDEENRTVTVGAGVRLSDLNAFLEPKGYVFPIDLGADPRIGGMIATNTTIGRNNLTHPNKSETGGMSGKPLRQRSTEVVRFIKQNSALPIIGVGGVDSAEAAREKLDAGASLVQIYSGLVYGGPGLAGEILRRL